MDPAQHWLSVGSQRIALHEIRVAEYWQRWAVFGSLGIALSGVAASIALSSPASLVLARVELALLLFADGLLQALQAHHIRLHPGAGWRLMSAVLSLGAAALVLLLPENLPLGLAISLFLLHAGLARCFLAVSLEPLPAWSWLLVTGTIAFVFGVLLLLLGPITSGPLHWASLALLIGFDGFWLLLTGYAARRRWPPERRMARLV
jgi:uncharacterized membrane protein HdeD (DUF308 family)